jgi:hypothetical protein
MTKQYGIKMKCYWEYLWNQTLKTFWELDGNTLGTNKKQNPLPSPKTRKKNIMPPKSFSLVA